MRIMFKYAPQPLSLSVTMSDVLSILCTHKRPMELTELAGKLSRHVFHCEPSRLEKMLEAYPSHVIVENDREYPRRRCCRVCVDIRVCGNKFNSKGQRCEIEEICDRLHLCTFFLDGKCINGDKCRFPHDLSSPHNTEILRRNFLDQVKPNDIFTLLHSKPGIELKICTFFNKGSCKNAEKCNFIHICKSYIERKCPSSCKINHNVLNENCPRLLRMHGIAIDQPITQTLQELRCKLMVPTLLPSATTCNLIDLAHKTHICTYNIRGKCHYGETCKKVHHTLPYLWVYQLKNESSDNMWNVFSSGEQTLIESSYCNIEDSVTLQCFGEKPVNMNLNKMEILVYKVDRLSTASSVTESPSHPFTTEWMWYWQDDSILSKVWIAYSHKNTFKNSEADKDSSQLEQCYQEFLEDPQLSSIVFKAGHHSYRFRFDTMQQQNQVHQTIRSVRRRPKELITEFNIRNYKDDMKTKHAKIGCASSSPIDFPDTWDIYNADSIVDPDANFQLVDVNKSTQEYKEVLVKFKSKSMPVTLKVLNIQRVQNMDLWEDFSRKQKRMKKKTGTLNERHLWHGTHEHHVQAICQQNFDFRCSGARVGTAYGQGSYFASNSSYSNKYSSVANDGRKFMFLAKVLVGDFSVGCPLYRRPPEKTSNGKNKCLFDSCVDSIVNPKIFVIFDKDQMYPDYLITYQ